MSASPDVSIGIGEIDPGEHICALYRGDEGRDQVLIPFMQEAVKQGDKVVGLFDGDPVDLLDRMALESLDEEPMEGQFELLPSEETYLADGSFVREDVLQFWEQRLSAAIQESRFRYVRTVGEMSWALRDAPGVGDLIRYESELNLSVWKNGSKVSLCLYDLEQFVDGALVVNILRTHPKVIVAGSVVENPWYVEPEELIPTLP